MPAEIFVDLVAHISPILFRDGVNCQVDVSAVVLKTENYVRHVSDCHNMGEMERFPAGFRRFGHS